MALGKKREKWTTKMTSCIPFFQNSVQPDVVDPANFEESHDPKLDWEILLRDSSIRKSIMSAVTMDDDLRALDHFPSSLFEYPYSVRKVGISAIFKLSNNYFHCLA